MEVGDIVRFKSKHHPGEHIVVRVTSNPYKIDYNNLEKWSKLEGWKTTYNLEKAALNWQFTYEYIGRLSNSGTWLATAKAEEVGLLETLFTPEEFSELGAYLQMDVSSLPVEDQKNLRRQIDEGELNLKCNK